MLQILIQDLAVPLLLGKQARILLKTHAARVTIALPGVSLEQLSLKALEFYGAGPEPESGLCIACPVGGTFKVENLVSAAVPIHQLTYLIHHTSYGTRPAPTGSKTRNILLKEPIVMTYLSHLRLPRGPGTHLALALAHVVQAFGPLFLA